MKSVEARLLLYFVLSLCVYFNIWLEKNPVRHHEYFLLLLVFFFFFYIYIYMNCRLILY